jgi:S1-C subfamily serine protease
LEANRREMSRGTRLSETVNRDFSRGVALLVFSYGFTERGGSELLRYQVDAEGRSLMRRLPDGRVVPHLGFGGSGPPLSSEGSATGFLVDSAGWILTNRHVARPWESEDQLESLRNMGLDVEPQFIELRAYFPPGEKSYALTVYGASNDADIGVMRTHDERVEAPVLLLADAAASVPPGEPLVFIGYPTGVHNLLFRISREERSQILEGAGENPLKLASALAERRLIQPLVISGTVSDTTGVEIIHTATATGGGSGGPVIGSGARVIGIHYAAVRSPIRGDPFQTQRAVRIGFALPILPALVQERLMPAITPPDTTQGQ